MVVSMSVDAKWWWLLLFSIAGAVVGFSEAKNVASPFVIFRPTDLKITNLWQYCLPSGGCAFSRTLSTTFAAGVPLIDALDSTAGATNNVVFYNATQKLKRCCDRSTAAVFDALYQSFPSMAIQMVGIGEESGSLEGDA